jgi:hypothetical protein
LVRGGFAIASGIRACWDKLPGAGAMGFANLFFDRELNQNQVGSAAFASIRNRLKSPKEVWIIRDRN